MKKSIARILATVMAVCLLAGCSSAPSASTATSTPDAASGSAAASSAAASSEAKPAAVNTSILMEADDNMINTYTLIAVNPDAPFVDENGKAVDGVSINTAGAAALIEWLLSDEGLNLAADYGVEQYGDHLFYVKDDAPKYTGEIAKATTDTATIRLSTTTSVYDSGLLGALLPVFEKEYGYTVEVQSAGTGKAIAAAEYGNADLILVHAKSKEDAFVDAGYGDKLDGFDSERLSFLYNYFVLCGPADDPAGVAKCANVLDAFAAIANGKYTFISRGDGSGTQTKELSLWPKDLGITEDAASFAGYTDWYTSANAGMGACLVMAEQMNAYILTDKATFLTFAANGGVMQ
ncbi:MAG: substrate-binding domain-containing protein [Lawsonibacter sp.]